MRDNASGSSNGLYEGFDDIFWRIEAKVDASCSELGLEDEDDEEKRECDSLWWW